MKLPLYLILLTIICVALSCGNAPKESTSTEKPIATTMKVEKMERPLEAVLTAKKENFQQKASDEKKKIYGEGLAVLEESKLVEQALQVGQKAKDFTLPNATGGQISLYEALANGPVVLMWYRGGWCPYCNIALHHMQEALPEFQKYGANLLAVSPELPDSSISTKEKNNLEFEVLSDANNKVGYEYNVVFKLTDDVAKIYEDSFGLSAYNGNDDAELPLAATYVIGTDRIIKYAFLDADYRNRAEPSDIVAVLKTL